MASNINLLSPKGPMSAVRLPVGSNNPLPSGESRRTQPKRLQALDLLLWLVPSDSKIPFEVKEELGEIANKLNVPNCGSRDDIATELINYLLEESSDKLGSEVAFKARYISKQILFFILEAQALNKFLDTNTLTNFNEKLFDNQNSFLTTADLDTVWARKFLLDHKGDESRIFALVRNRHFLLAEAIQQLSALQHSGGINGHSHFNLISELKDLLEKSPDKVRAIERLSELSEIGAFESPNQLSKLLDQIETEMGKLLSMPGKPRVAYLQEIEKKLLIRDTEGNINRISHEEIIDETKRQTVYFVGKVLESVQEQEPTRRTFLSYGWKLPASVVALGGLGGAGSYLAVNKLSSGGNQIYDLQPSLNELIDKYETTDFGKLYSDACKKADENMRIDTAKATPVEWNTKIFRVLAVYLEPEPSDDFLREELQRFKKESLPRIRNNPVTAQDVSAVEEVIQNFDKIGIANRQALSQQLIRLPDRTKRYLEDVFKILISNYAISTRQITVPPDVLSNLTLGLRNIFGDDYFKPVVLRGIRRDQLPEKTYVDFCTPCRMIGPEVVTVDSSSGYLARLITGLQPIDNEMRRIRALYVLRCFSGAQVYGRIRNHLISQVTKLGNNKEELQKTANTLNAQSDTEQIRRMMETTRHELDLFTRELCPAYAYVLTGFHRVAEGIKPQAEQLGVEWNPSHPQL